MQTIALPTNQPSPQSNWYSFAQGLAKAFGVPEGQVPDPQALLPSKSPVSSGPGRFISHSMYSKIPTREVPPSFKNAPQCLGESSGALLLGEVACNSFHVGDGLTMTNCHCTKKSAQSLANGMFVMVGRDGGQQRFRCKQVHNCSQEFDYSIVSCPGLVGKVPVVQMATDKPKTQEQLFLSTHDFSDGITKRSDTGRVWGDVYDREGNSRNSMLAWISSIHGNSGSGVFNRKQEVAGLLWGGYVMERKNSLFTPITDIMRDLERRQPQIYQRIKTAQKNSIEGTGDEKISQCRSIPAERSVAGQAHPQRTAEAAEATGRQ